MVKNLFISGLVLTALLTGCSMTNQDQGFLESSKSNDLSAITSDAAGYSWSAEAFLLQKRFSAGMIALNGKLYTIGGYKDMNYLNESVSTAVEEYDPVTKKWTLKAPMPVGFGSPRLAAVGGIIYAFCGGLSAENTVASDKVLAYDPVANTWTQVSTLPYAEKRVSDVASVNGIIYVLGFLGGYAAEASEFYAFNPQNKTWTAKTFGLPTSVVGCRLQALQGKIYLMGGKHNTGKYTTEYYSRTYLYNPAADTWSSGKDMNTARRDFTTAVANGKIYVFGGYDPASSWLKSTEVYDPALNQWTTINNMPQNTIQSEACALSGKVYLAGGYSEATSPSVLNTVYSLNSSSENFTLQIEAENYNNMSGIIVGPSSEGQCAGYFDTGDWLDYNITLPQSGFYQVEYRVSCINGGGKILIGSGGSGTLSTTVLSGTGGWENWTTQSSPQTIWLNAGQQYLWISSIGGAYNINYFRIIKSN